MAGLGQEIMLAGASLCLCPNILTTGAPTAGPIGTSVVSIDMPERRKEDGVICGAIRAP